MAWFGITPSRSSRLRSADLAVDKKSRLPTRPPAANPNSWDRDKWNKLLIRMVSDSQASGSLLRCRYDSMRPSLLLVLLRRRRNPTTTHQPIDCCAVILYGVNSAQNAMMRSDEWKNDARNPNAKSGGH
ncbi:ATPase- F0 complex- subunit J [Apiospora saccharicola]